MAKLQQASLLSFCAPPPPPRPAEEAPKRMAVARAEAEREIPWPERRYAAPSMQEVHSGHVSSRWLCLLREDGCLDQVFFVRRLQESAEACSCEAPALGLAEGRKGGPVASWDDLGAFKRKMAEAMSLRTGRRYVDFFDVQGPYGRSEPVPGVQLGIEDWRVQR